jgi:hypothetical protein
MKRLTELLIEPLGMLGNCGTTPGKNLCPEQSQ